MLFDDRIYKRADCTYHKLNVCSLFYDSHDNGEEDQTEDTE